MHGTHLRYLRVAVGAVVVGLLAAGTPLPSLLPFALILTCPLMMIVMMLGMGGRSGHGSGGPGHDSSARDRDDAAAGRRPGPRPVTAAAGSRPAAWGKWRRSRRCRQ